MQAAIESAGNRTTASTWSRYLLTRTGSCYNFLKMKLLIKILYPVMLYICRLAGNKEALENAYLKQERKILKRMLKKQGIPFDDIKLELGKKTDHTGQKPQDP